MHLIKLRLVLVAVLIAVGVVGGHGALYSAFTGQPWAVANLDLVNVGIAATPFIVLALLAVRHVLTWLMAPTLTILLWGWFLYITVSYHGHPDGSGANIGAGAIMTLSPFLIAIVVAAVHFAQEDARR